MGTSYYSGIKNKVIIKKRFIIRTLIWLLFISLLLPYRFTRTNLKSLSYVVAAFFIIFSGLIFFIYTRKKSLLFKDISINLHVVLYFSLLLISQFVTMFQIAELNINDLVWLLGYIIAGIVAFFVIPLVLIENNLHTWILMMSVFGTISSLIAIYIALTGDTSFLFIPIRQVQIIRLPYINLFATSSIFYEANRFAIVAYFGFISSVHNLQSKKKLTIINIMYAVICVVGIFFSWSRAVYISLIFSIWLLFFFKSKYKFVYILLTIAVLGIAYEVINNNLFLKHLFLGEGLGRRKLFWSAGIKLIQKKPIWGYGFGNPDLVQNYLYQMTGFATALHSTPLALSFHSGILTTICYFLIFIISTIRITISKDNQITKWFLYSGVGGMFVAAFFLDYNIGGASYGSFVQTTFLGLASLTTLVHLK